MPIPPPAPPVKEQQVKSALTLIASRIDYYEAIHKAQCAVRATENLIPGHNGLQDCTCGLAKAFRLVEALLLQRAQAIQELQAENQELKFNADVYCANCGSCGIEECCPAPKCRFFKQYTGELGEKAIEAVEDAKEWKDRALALEAAITARTQEVEQLQLYIRTCESDEIARLKDHIEAVTGRRPAGADRSADAARVSRAPQITFSDRTVPSDHPAEPSGGSALADTVPADAALQQAQATIQRLEQEYSRRRQTILLKEAGRRLAAFEAELTAAQATIPHLQAFVAEMKALSEAWLKAGEGWESDPAGRVVLRHGQVLRDRLAALLSAIPAPRAPHEEKHEDDPSRVGPLTAGAAATGSTAEKPSGAVTAAERTEPAEWAGYPLTWGDEG